MVSSKVFFTFLFALTVAVVHGQSNRYMVFFKDKAGSPFSIDAPGAFLSQRAIDRRIRQGIAVSEQDLPVNVTYVDDLQTVGVDVYYRSRWMNGVLVQCAPGDVPLIEGFTFVDRVELVAPNAKLVPSGRRKRIQRLKAGKLASQTDTQLHQIGLDIMQGQGYRGEGIVIGIFDSGFQGVDITVPFQHLVSNQQIDVDVSKDFVFNSDNVFQYDEHGTEVFSVIAAFQDGTFTGGAHEARYQLFVTEDVTSEYRIEEYNWLFAAERADSAGVDVINSSLGYYDFDDASMNYAQSEMDGLTTVVTRAAQLAADRGIVVVCSAGNEGGVAWQIITAPADARDVLSVANVNSSGQRSGTSSKGPSADGRIKPDVAAMGVNTIVVLPDGSIGSATGTSVSSPLIASLAAGLWQRYPNLTNRELMEAIRLSSSQAKSPDNLLGYGIPNFAAVANYLDNQEQEDDFAVYPNPVYADTLVIRPIDPTVIMSCQVELISAQGQVVFATQVDFSWLNRTFVADLGGLAEGYYFVRIYWGNKRYIYKLIRS
jgi:subtilisin family serine protease